MDMQMRVFVSKRPLGVSIIMAGGLKGYSGCKAIVGTVKDFARLCRT